MGLRGAYMHRLRVISPALMGWLGWCARCWDPCIIDWVGRPLCDVYFGWAVYHGVGPREPGACARDERCVQEVILRLSSSSPQTSQGLQNLFRQRHDEVRPVMPA